MEYKERVVAITVTFNSSELVLKAIKALKAQTRKVDFIVVVDNHSRKEERMKIDAAVKNDPEIILVNMKENFGGAGGFCAGMKYVKEKLNADWYWLMDDDAFPENNCLEKLMEHAADSDDIGCLVPLIWGIDKKDYQLYHHKILSKYLTKDRPVVTNIDQLSDIVQIEANAFVGPLVSKRAVDEVGIADGSLFIYGDDLEYTYRISRKYKIYLVKTAQINHRDILVKNTILDPKAWWKDYYDLRNRLFFIEKYATSFPKRIIGKSILGLKIIKRICDAIVKKDYKGYRKKRINILFKAWSDGNKNKRGKVIDPVEYCRNL